MRYIALDGKEMISREKAHQYLAQKFNFPKYYGGNLDALWDLLTTSAYPLQIDLCNKAELVHSLGDYGERLIKVFAEAAVINQLISFQVWEA